MKTTLVIASALTAAFVTHTGVRPSMGDPRTPLHVDTTPGDADSVFRIEEPGSYYLMAPLSPEFGKSGIEIAASGVTLDLMGFPVTGAPYTLDGIVVEGPTRTGISIENGSVHGWTGDGMNLAEARHVRLGDLFVFDNVGSGAIVGEAANVRDCSFENNGASGLMVEDGLLVRDSFSRNNGQEGFHSNSSGLASRVQAGGNGSSGVYFGTRSAVHDTISHGNGNLGILAGDLVEGSVGHSNGQNGIQVSYGVVEGNSAKANEGTGIYFGGVARGNVAYANHEGGLWAGMFGGLAESNGARGNTGAGLRLENRSMAQSNHSTWNDVGLRAETLSLVRENYCMSNSGNEYQYVGNVIRGPIHPSVDVNLGDHPGINVGN